MFVAEEGLWLGRFCLCRCRCVRRGCGLGPPAPGRARLCGGCRPAREDVVRGAAPSPRARRRGRGDRLVRRRSNGDPLGRLWSGDRRRCRCRRRRCRGGCGLVHRSPRRGLGLSFGNGRWRRGRLWSRLRFRPRCLGGTRNRVVGQRGGKSCSQVFVQVAARLLGRGGRGRSRVGRWRRWRGRGGLGFGGRPPRRQHLRYVIFGLRA